MIVEWDKHKINEIIQDVQTLKGLTEHLGSKTMFLAVVFLYGCYQIKGSVGGVAAAVTRVEKRRY